MIDRGHFTNGNFSFQGGTLAARSWAAVPFQHHREHILKALKIDKAEPSALYSTAALRVIADEGVTWIGGAVGCPPSLNIAQVMDWQIDDISDVILWNPRSNECQVMGEAKGQATLTLPYPMPDHLTVYGDPFSFFRAWAERRAKTFGRHQSRKGRKWAHGAAEPLDGGLPGALIVGDQGRITWRDLSAQTISAGPGVDRDELNRAVFRAAKLPRVLPLRKAA